MRPGDRQVRSGTLQTATKRLAGGRRHGLRRRVPAADPPHRPAHRKGPNNTLSAGPDDPGSPVGDRRRRGRPRRDPPGPRHARRLRRASSPGRSSSAWRSRSTTRSSARPTTPGCRSIPSGSPPRRRHDRLRREPAEEVPGHLPDQLRQRPEGLSREVLRRRCGYWIDHGVRIFRVDNPHTKPFAFWEWLLGECATSDPDVVFLAEAFTRPPMMRKLARWASTRATRTSPGATASRSSSEYLERAARGDRADYMRPELLRRTRPTSCTAYLQYGGPAAFKIRPCSRPRCRRVGRLLRLRAVRERRRDGQATRSTCDSEKYQLGPRDWDAASEGLARAVHHQAQRRSAGAIPPAAAAQPEFHQPDNDAILAYSKRATADDDAVIVVVNLDPHGTRETTGRTSTCRRSA